MNTVAIIDAGGRALAQEQERELVSIPFDSTCTLCHQFKPCVRCVNIGWVCLDCQPTLFDLDEPADVE